LTHRFIWLKVKSIYPYYLLDKESFYRKKGQQPFKSLAGQRLMTLGKTAFKGGEPSEAFFILIESPCQNQESAMKGGDFIG